MTNYYAVGTDGSISFQYGNSAVRPPKILVWDGYMGPLVGNGATVTGLGASTACDMTIQVTLNGSTISGTVLSATKNRLGEAQNIPCPQLFPAGQTVTGTRVF